jgi:TonB-linked SusC/RagA family outer membrane protein
MPGSGDNYRYGLSRLFWSPPYNSPGLVDNKIVNTVDLFSQNPLEYFYNNGYNRNYMNDLTVTVRFDYKLDFLTEGLKLHAKISNYNQMNNRKVYNKSVQTYRPFLSDNGSISYAPQKADAPFGFWESSGKKRDVYFEAGLNYDRSFGPHSIGGLFLYNQKKLYNPSLAYVIPKGHQGLVGRLTYNYQLRYLAEFNVGYNGTENFAPGKRFGFFPAFSLGWVVSEESFFPENDVIDYVKIRGTYGIVGNDLLGNDETTSQRFLYIPSSFQYSTSVYYYGTPGSTFQSYLTAFEGALGNPLVTWERAKKTDVGIDVTLFNNKIKLTGDYFYEIRDNILSTPQTSPETIGITLPASNLGEMENWGYEAEFGFNDKINDFNYWVKANYNFVRNKILFQDEVTRTYPYMQRTGNSAGQPFGYVVEGFYNTWEDVNDANRPRSSWQSNRIIPGDVRYKDVNGDGVIDSFDAVPIGFSDFPEISYGLSFGGMYKGFDFSVLFQGASNVNINMTEPGWRPFDNALVAINYVLDNSWTYEKYQAGESISLPRLTCDQTNTHNYQTNAIRRWDASYVRLKNVEIGYQISNKLLSRLLISSCRIYVNGNNLATWSGLPPGYDPEQPAVGGGADQAWYPQQRIFNAGVNIQF